MNDGPDNGGVTARDDNHWEDESAKEEGQDEDPVRPVRGQVIEAAAGQVTFGNVFAHAEEGQGGEDGRVEPNEEASNIRPAACRLLVNL